MRATGHALPLRASLRRAPGDEVTLRFSWWQGRLPVTGDGLVTVGGRKYLILEVLPSKHSTPEGGGERQRGLLRCVVLPRETVIPGEWFWWHWRRRPL